ncbi:PxORF89 peptide [Plutella xylostella granulovirus]|uniref:PxORF89 peptide n=1 Tax=Plutella xylostella granulovirus TaxID=98383 RepID=Q9DVU4_9BBAC|nr:PxORF89 peptide [Plutella xylostella granulovirus]AAG27387.1 PxORF89 peptide [Plutella xylostella granulovirus]
MRNVANYELWRNIIKNHPLYAKTADVTIDRQKRGDDQPASSLWHSLTKTQDYKQSTKNEFLSILIKVIYCLIDDVNLTNFTYDCVDEFKSLIEGRPTLETEEFIRRLLDMNSVGKKRLQATINYYTNAVHLPKYWIPSNVELPSDTIRRQKKKLNKTIVLRDDFIKPIVEYINTTVLRTHYKSAPGVYRASIAFNVIMGTGLRITNSYQIRLQDLREILEHGEHKVLNLTTKHSQVDFCFITCKDEASLRRAIQLYERVPEDLLNKISPKSPTKYKDFNELIDAVFGDTLTSNFKSTMIRNYVADKLVAEGLPMTKISKLMNHKSSAAIKHYVNQYHAGPERYLVE